MLQTAIYQVPTLIDLCRRSKNNLLIVGDPGVGKSQTIKSLENEHCKVTMLTGSSTYEETVNGIPRDNKDKNVQDYTRPKWFVDMLEWSKEHTGKDDYQIFFIDEYNTADPQVLKTFLSILTERQIPTQPEPIPDDVVIVAAMNPANQNEGEELIRPMASRFLTVEILSTMDSFKQYITGENENRLPEICKMRENPEKLDAARIEDFLSQIVPEDWQHYESGAYHEINPRSMDNFFRALSWVDNREYATPLLSMAFFGKHFKYPEDKQVVEAKREARKAKVKNGSVNPTMDELKEMTTEDLKALNIKMLAKGGSGISVVANISQILMERGEVV